MGSRGPVGKRSDQRVRRNKENQDTEQVSVSGTVEPPSLGFSPDNELTMELYESVLASGYTHTYEPSDWHVLRFLLFNVDTYITQISESGKVNAHALSELMSGFGSLLMTEGERRRLKMEIQREESKPSADVAVMNDYKKMFGI